MSTNRTVAIEAALQDAIDLLDSLMPYVAPYLPDKSEIDERIERIRHAKSHRRHADWEEKMVRAENTAIWLIAPWFALWRIWGSR